MCARAVVISYCILVIASQSLGCARYQNVLTIELSHRSKPYTMLTLRESDVVSCFGVEKRIQELSVLKRIVLESPFQDKAGLFQNARRSGIVRVRLGVYPIEWKFLETILYERWNDFRHDAVSPEFLTQPKAELGDMPMDVLADANADAANR
jgi:hypothetical protein